MTSRKNVYNKKHFLFNKASHFQIIPRFITILFCFLIIIFYIWLILRLLDTFSQIGLYISITSLHYYYEKSNVNYSFLN